GVAELGFQHSVDTPHLLLFTELQAVAVELGFAILPMLPWNEVALLDGALLGMAALALQVEFHALAPALPADRADVSCQCVLLLTLAVSDQLPATSFQVRFTAWPAFLPLTRYYTLRFFGGRQPLWGIGVT